MSAYNEHGITETVDFCYGEIDPPPNPHCDIDIVIELNQRIWAWVYQELSVDLDGLMCRCIIALWIFVPSLRDYNQTQIAARFGKKKQSLNRWIVDFKREFPEIGNHLQHTRQ